MFTTMKNTLKHIGIYTVLIIIFIASISLYWTLFFQSTEKAERYVIEKQSKKGLYFSPRYEIVTDEGEHASYVSKKTFDKLEFGDKITGYETAEYGFYTKLDFIYDSFLLVPLIVVLGFIVMVYTILMLMKIPMIDRIFSRKEKESSSNWVSLCIIIVYSFCAIVFILLMSNNLLHKVVPIAKTETEGHIVKRDFSENITSKGDYSTFDFTIRFADEKGREYQVNKAVSRSTFNNYEYISSIDVSYRNRNPYDIFIKEESITNYISVLIGVFPLMYALAIYTLYLIYQHYFKRNKKQEKSDDDTV